MDDNTLAHVHLMFVHIPIVGIPLGLLLLLVGMKQRSQDIKRAALAVLALTAIAAIPAYLTGESAEEVAEDSPGISEAAIEDHEESAELTFIVAEILGVLALLSLVFGARQANWEPFTNRAVVITAIVASLLLVRTANLGGRISHPEVFGSGGGNASAENEGSEHEGEEDDDD